MSTTARVILEPDGVVLDDTGILLHQLVEGGGGGGGGGEGGGKTRQQGLSDYLVPQHGSYTGELPTKCHTITN